MYQDSPAGSGQKKTIGCVKLQKKKNDETFAAIGESWKQKAKIRTDIKN